MTLPVVFDLDGTLVDSLPGIATAANTFLAEHGREPLPKSRIGSFVGRGENVFLERLMQAGGLDLARFHDVKPRFLEIYTVASRDTRLFPGVAEMLDGFRRAGVPLGLCTNKPSGPVGAVLQAVALEDAFGAVVAGDSLPARKPDPAPLRHVLDALGAGQGLYVGDSEVDAETAQRTGVPFALFTEGIRTTPVSEIPHDFAFDDFGDLAEIHAVVSRMAGARD